MASKEEILNYLEKILPENKNIELIPKEGYEKVMVNMRGHVETLYGSDYNEFKIRW